MIDETMIMKRNIPLIYLILELRRTHAWNENSCAGVGRFRAVCHCVEAGNSRE